MWYVHSIKYLTMRRNEFGTVVTAWIDLETVVLSECESQKATYCMILFYAVSGIGESIEIENRLVVVQGQRKRKTGAVFISGGEMV